MSKKKAIGIVCLVLVVAMLGLVGYVVWDMLFGGAGGPAVDESNLMVFMDGEYYLGTESYSGTGLSTSSTFDLAATLGYTAEDAVVFTAAAGDIATLSGTNITVNKAGRFTLTAKTSSASKEYKIVTVEGINVTNYEEFYCAITQQEPVVVHSDITLQVPPAEGFRGLEPANDDRFDLYANYYGNGKKIDCSAVFKDNYGEGKDYKPHDDVGFYIKARGIVVRDAHFIGAVPDPDTMASKGLSVFEKISGTLVDLVGKEDFIPEVSFVNSILENSHKLIRVSHGDLNLDGVIMRNSSDSCLSVAASNLGTSIININNTVMANAVVSTICCYCTEVVDNPAKFAKITFTGFFDAYNWKNDNDVKLIPGTESAAGPGNYMIAQNVKNPTYDSFVYPYNGGRWLHLALMVIASPGTNTNETTFVGLEGVGMEMRTFPLPSLAYQFIKQVEMGGYVTNPPLAPDAKMSDNPNLYNDLRYGRK